MDSESIDIQLEVENAGVGEIIKTFDLIKSISKGLEKYQRITNSEVGITPAQFSLLNIMRENQLYSPSTLAKLHKSTRPTITGILDTLEKKSLVKRDLNNKDKRRFNVFLTNKGLELKKKIPGMEKTFHSCCSDLNADEVNRLAHLLEKLYLSLESTCFEVVNKIK